VFVVSAWLLADRPAHAQSKNFDDALQANQSSTASTQSSQAGPGQPHDVSGTLLTLGIVSLSVGYGVALVGGGITTGIAASETSKYRASCVSSGPLNFIPLIGPWLFAGNYPDHQVVGYGTGTPYLEDCNGSRGLVQGVVATSEVLQLGGTGLIAAAIVMRAMAPDVPVGSAGTLRFIPGAVGAPTGLTLELEGF
jgi:hypothetical protein